MKFNAASNINATRLGGIRTGGHPTVSPVRKYLGPGPTRLPRSLNAFAPVAHPVPRSDNPTVTKCERIRAIAGAKRLSQFKRKVENRASRLRAAGATGWPSFEEFVILYGNRATYTSEEYADYLSVFPLGAKKRK